ncbi:MAG: hypothetical protein IJF56_09310 [Clostridia bacterium]|nr:hypothetical protein [Clostridia bacterium]
MNTYRMHHGRHYRSTVRQAKKKRLYAWLDQTAARLTGRHSRFRHNVRKTIQRCMDMQNKI